MVVIVVAISLNYIGSFYFQRFDLTSEKRHTLNPSTIELLNSLNDVVFVKCYLKGDFPSDVKRLQKAVKEKLDEMRAYSNGKLEYEFINPSNGTDKENKELYSQLVENGLNYSNFLYENETGVSEIIYFPGCVISYFEQEQGLQLLKSREPNSEMIHNSISNLEYEFANVIRQLSSPKKPVIAFIEGHGELNENQTYDLQQTLSETYSVKRVELNGKLKSLELTDAIIIARPIEAFEEKDKFVIDQFIMNGGKALFFIDAMDASMDSLLVRAQIMSLPLKTNLSDQLFHYGVRISNDLILDKRCAPILLNVGQRGDQPQFRPMPWYFQPVLVSDSGHPVVNSLDPIITEFCSSIELVGENPEVKKTVLFKSSPSSKIFKSPVRVNFNVVRHDFRPQHPERNIAVLMEGRFSSLFENRIPTAISNNSDIKFKAKNTKPTKILVVSDGDLIKNRFDINTGRYWPMGWDRMTKQKIYANREFLQNVMNYMLDDNSLITLRSRKIKLRKLDVAKIKSERLYWQVVNVSSPLIVLLIMGIVLYFIRKRKFA